jgi:hypothetical protein
MPEENLIGKDDFIKALAELNEARDHLFEAFNTCAQVGDGKYAPATLSMAPPLVVNLYSKFSNVLQYYNGVQGFLKLYYNKHKSGKNYYYTFKDNMTKEAAGAAGSIVQHMFFAMEAQETLNHMIKLYTMQTNAQIKEIKAKSKESIDGLTKQVEELKKAVDTMNAASNPVYKQIRPNE